MSDDTPSGTHVNPPWPGSIESLRAHQGRRVLVCLTGGIACYKLAHVVSALVQAGVETTVAMTPAATRFVGPLTFEALSGRRVHLSAWEDVEARDPQHIRLARSMDVVLVAPCTMDAAARLAAGRADDIVSLLVSAVDRQRQAVIVAPSMNEVMFNQPATQRNLRQLTEDGFLVLSPGRGWQACRTEGVGRLPEPEELLAVIDECLASGPRGD